MSRDKRERGRPGNWSENPTEGHFEECSAENSLKNITLLGIHEQSEDTVSYGKSVLSCSPPITEEN
jgi:hypothetical protein